MRARLKKRYPRAPDTSRTRWVWVVRHETTGRNGTVIDQQDSIGYWAGSRDKWQPRPYKGRQLPRLSERQAQDRLRAFCDRMEQGKQDKPERTGWDRFADSAIDNIRGTVRRSTVATYTAALDIFGKLVEPKSPREVDQPMAKRFIQQAKSAGKSDATVNKYLSGLRRIWNAEFVNSPNPFQSTKSDRQGGVRRFKVASKDWRRITPDELAALLRGCDNDADPENANRWKAILLLAYTAGLRAAEIHNLRWSDVDFDGTTVGVNPRTDGPTEWVWNPKDSERRTLPITPETKLAFLRVRSVRPAHPYVFVSQQRYDRILAARERGTWREGCDVLTNFPRRYKVRCKWAKLPEMDFHALRKTAITNWLEGGVPPHEAQSLAGHSSFETTRKFYTKVDRSAIDRVRCAAQLYTTGVAG